MRETGYWTTPTTGAVLASGQQLVGGHAALSLTHSIERGEGGGLERGRRKGAHWSIPQIPYLRFHLL